LIIFHFRSYVLSKCGEPQPIKYDNIQYYGQTACGVYSCPYKTKTIFIIILFCLICFCCRHSTRSYYWQTYI